MQDKISNLQSQLQQAQSQKAASSAADMEQLSQLRNAQSQSRHQSEESEQIVEELRNEVKSLLEELKSLNVKYEDSEAERQAELDAHREEMNSMEGIKKKYEQSKTELRNMKGERLLPLDVEHDLIDSNSDIPTLCSGPCQRRLYAAFRRWRDSGHSRDCIPVID